MRALKLETLHQSMTLSPNMCPQRCTLKVALLYNQMNNDICSLGQTWQDPEQY